MNVTAPAVPPTVMPVALAAGVTVSDRPSSLRFQAATLSLIVTLLTTMLAPSVIAPWFEGEFVSTKLMSAVLPGVRPVTVVPSVVQLLLALPSDWAHTLLPALAFPPFQTPLVQGVALVTEMPIAVAEVESEPTVKFVALNTLPSV